MEKERPNLDIKFQYALTLIKTRSLEKNRMGITFLQGGENNLLGFLFHETLVWASPAVRETDSRSKILSGPNSAQ